MMLAAGAAASAHALTLTNCGQEWRFDSPPQRTLIYSQTSLENMLALGLASSITGIVGYSKQQDSIPSPWTSAAHLSVREDSAPWSGEAILAAAPDFIYSGSFYWFHSPETPGRDRLARWGIATWLSESLCQGLQSNMQSPLTFDDIFAEVRNIARIFDVQPRAEELIARLRQEADVARVNALRLPHLSMMWWYSGLSVPYVAGDFGAPALLTRTVGGKNIFADIRELWPTLSWEVIAERDPDVIVIGDLLRGGPGDSAKEKIAFLEANPLTAGMRAVRYKRYIILPGYDMDPSARSVLALKRLVTQLQLLNLKDDSHDLSRP